MRNRAPIGSGEMSDALMCQEPAFVIGQHDHPQADERFRSSSVSASALPRIAA
jgi:hypothetical protein